MTEASFSVRDTALPPPRSVHRITRLLWWSAGADTDLLSRCPRSDGVKYEGLGGVVLATGLLAFVSSAYAFYTVFAPKDQKAMEQQLDPWTLGVAVVLGAVWGVVIFNLDRFIVSSAGKGDGTEKITWSEFMGALPRLVMAIIIGVCISAPLEIRILKSEIDAELQTRQSQYESQRNAASRARYETEDAELKARIEDRRAQLAAVDQRFESRRGEVRDQERKADETFEKRKNDINAQRRKLEDEIAGTGVSRKVGCGPACEMQKQNLARMEAELERDRSESAQRFAKQLAEFEQDKSSLEKHRGPLETEIAALEAQRAAIAETIAKEGIENRKAALAKDGLLERIHISHEIGGSVPLWIMLLLLAIETGPIFFKMMLTRGPYEYLLDNDKRLYEARAGIEPAAVVYTDGAREIREDVYHWPKAVLEEEQRRLETERTLARTAHDVFVAETTKRIEQNPSEFIRRAES